VICEGELVRVLGLGEFRLPGLQLKKVYSLTISEEGLGMRLSLGEKGVGATVLIQGPTFNYGSRLKVAPPTLCTGTLYSMVCTECGEDIGSLGVARLLPLPSGNWRQDCRDWFCCVNKLDKAPELGCGQGDLLYNSHSLSVKSSNLVGAVSSVDIVRCKRCSSDLGHSEGDMVVIWGHSVLFRGEEGEVRVLGKIKSALDTFIVLVNSFVVESIGLMPKVIVRDRVGKVFLLWFVDKELRTYQSNEDQGVCEEKVVMKVLIKDISDEAFDETIQQVTVSNQMLAAGFEYLENINRHLPVSFKQVNGFRVSYLPKIT